MSVFGRIKSLFTGGGKAPARKKTEEAVGEKGKRPSGETEGGRGSSGHRRRRSRGRGQGQRTEHEKSQPQQQSRGGGGGGRGHQPKRTSSGEGAAARGSEYPAGPARPAAKPESPRTEEREQHGRSRGRGKRHGQKSRSSELGGAAPRIAFPDLLEVDHNSEEFLKNELRPLGLSDRVVLALAANRFKTPTDIQTAVIPPAMRGMDIMGQAKTGTGKTIAFLMPIFESIRQDSNTIQALIVVPTRELCRQVSWEADRFGRSLGVKVLSVYGGTSVSREVEQLKRGAHLLVGTPGRLLDHIFNNNVDLSTLKILVLDEADRMFDIGFRQDVIKIIKACPDKRQIMLLSATLDEQVEELRQHYMHDPVRLYLSKDEISVESIWQRFITVERHSKMEKLVKLLEHQKPTQSIIFTNTKRMSDALAMRLAKLGLKARCIHSDLNQNKRERIMDEFRTGKIEHLVATDVAARGLDITGISHVINYDIPANPEDYIHRVGRTGRMGAAGKAFTFVTSNEGKELTAIEKLLNKPIEEWEGD